MVAEQSSDHGRSLRGCYAPDPWEPGASFSHLREDMYLSGNANALMTPNLNTGEAIHVSEIDERWPTLDAYEPTLDA